MRPSCELLPHVGTVIYVSLSSGSLSDSELLLPDPSSLSSSTYISPTAVLPLTTLITRLSLAAEVPHRTISLLSTTNLTIVHQAPL
jgi:hypothetical protein